MNRNSEESMEMFLDDNSAAEVDDLQVPGLSAQKFRPMFQFGRERALTPLNGNILGWPKVKKTEPVCKVKQKVVAIKNADKENLGCKKLTRKSAAAKCVKQKPAQQLKHDLERESEKIIFQPTVSSAVTKCSKQKPTQDLENGWENITFQPTVSSTPLKSSPKIERNDKVEASKVVKGKKYVKAPGSIYPVCPIVLYD